MRRSRWVAPVVVLVVVLGGVIPAVAASPVSDGSVTGQESVTSSPVSDGSVAAKGSVAPVAPQQADNETGAGTLVVGALEGQNARLSGTDLNARLETALADAGSPGERASVAGAAMSDGLARLDSLQSRASAVGGDGVTGERAAIRAEATDLHLLAVRIDRLASDLPDSVRTEHGLTDERIDRLRRGASDLAGDRGAFGPAFYTNVSLMVDDYNDRAEPSGFVASRLTGEVVNLHVTAPSDRTVVSFAIDDDGRLQDVRAGARTDATLRLTTDRETMREITSADDPQSALLDAIDRGDVKFRGLGLGNRVKWFAFGVLKGVADTVRGLLEFLRDLS